VTSVSIYLFAGDFADVLRRYGEGTQQIYQTHDEVARLIHDLLGMGQRLNIYSFITPERCEERPIEGLRIINLGAKDYSARSLLKAAVTEDDADAIVAQFPNVELLRAVSTKRRRAMAVLASSYNSWRVRSLLERRRLVALLNNPAFELVSNHCLPATQHLARIGVKPEKLIPWDVPHPFDPASWEPKKLSSRRPFKAIYVGSIMEGKGVPELIRAIALIRRDKGMEVHCTLAGLGDVSKMQAVGRKLGVADLLAFVGLIGNTDVFKMMVAADLVIVPSRTGYPEGFPLTMFEAIASRTPIVCSDHPVFRPVIADGRNASVFSAGDYRSLAAAIQRTLDDPALYAELSSNAKLTWEALKGPADWRTMIVKWVMEGPSSPWIRDHLLGAIEERSSSAAQTASQ
jgi:glycosyltransferase involved in cell wall biosynthesis